MPAKKKPKPKIQHSNLTVRVSAYRSRTGVGINYRASQPRAESATRVFSESAVLELEGVCTGPEDRAGVPYSLYIEGAELWGDQSSHTLDDYHQRDEKGQHLYRRSGAKQVPVFKPPSLVGYLNKRHGEDSFSGSVWVPPTIFGHMLMQLQSGSQCYLAIMEVKESRDRRISDFSLQNFDPEAED